MSILNFINIMKALAKTCQNESALGKSALGISTWKKGKVMRLSCDKKVFGTPKNLMRLILVQKSHLNCPPN